MQFTDKCPICKSKPLFTIKKRIYIDAYKDIQKKIAIEYFNLCNDKTLEEVISMCSNCEAMYRAKFFGSNEIKEIYNRLYFNLEEKIVNERGFIYNDKDFLNACSQKMLNMVKDIENKHNIKFSTIFDIGGRDGFRLKGLVNSGYNCKVFDPISCPPCDKRIKKEYIWSSQMNEFEKADFILLCNVLEHCTEPYNIMQTCYGHLNDNGFLYIEIPNDLEGVLDWIFFSSLFRKNLGIDNTHYIFYSKSAINYLLSTSGFHIKNISYGILPKFNVKLREIISQKMSSYKIPKNIENNFSFLSLMSEYCWQLVPRMFRRVGNKLYRIKPEV